MNLTLHRGRDRAESIGAIAERHGLSRRTVEKELERLVQTGVPVVACPRGVYVAVEAEEIRAYAKSLGGRIAAVSDRIRALERAAERMERVEQTTLFWKWAEREGAA